MCRLPFDPPPCTLFLWLQKRRRICVRWWKLGDGQWAVGGRWVGVLWPPVVASGIHKTFDPTTPGELMVFMIPTPPATAPPKNLDPLSVPSYLISTLAFLFFFLFMASFYCCAPSISLSCPSLSLPAGHRLRSLLLTIFFPSISCCLLCTCMCVCVWL